MKSLKQMKQEQIEFDKLARGVVSGKIELESQSAKDARACGYGDAEYWAYLDLHAKEMHAKGVKDAMTQTLSVALNGNSGI